MLPIKKGARRPYKKFNCMLPIWFRGVHFWWASFFMMMYGTKIQENKTNRSYKFDKLNGIQARSIDRFHWGSKSKGKIVTTIVFFWVWKETKRQFSECKLHHFTQINLIKSNRNQIIISIWWLIFVWFNKISRRFIKYY